MGIRDWFAPRPSDDDRRDRAHGRRRDDSIRAWVSQAWLGLLTIMFIWMFLSLDSAINKINDNRVEGTEQRCQLTQAVIDAAVGLGAPKNAPGLNNLKELKIACDKTLDQAKEDANGE